MKKTITIVLSLILAASSALAAPKQPVLNSPDGRITISVSVDGGVKYCVSKDGVQLLAPSGISMTLSDGTVFYEHDDGSVQHVSASRDGKNFITVFPAD